MGFNEAARAKALETRKRNAETRRLKKQNEITGTATTEIAASTFGDPIPPDAEITKVESMILDVMEIPSVKDINWNLLPLQDAINKLADMKREYDRAAQIVMQRQSREPVLWTCWTQLNKEKAPKAALAQCKNKIQEGKWVSKDDGAKDDEGNVKPVVCCSMICYMFYQSERSKMRDKSRGL